MRTLVNAMRTLVTIAAMLIAMPSHALYRCESDGKVEYRDTPCAKGKQSQPDIKDDRPQAAPEQAKGAGDEAERRRKAAEAEKARAKAARCDYLLQRLIQSERRAMDSQNYGYQHDRAADRAHEYQLECGKR